jgi:hypothetical protein
LRDRSAFFTAIQAMISLWLQPTRFAPRRMRFGNQPSLSKRQIYMSLYGTSFRRQEQK